MIRSFPNSFSKKTRTSSGRGKKKLAVLSSPTKLEEDLSHTHKKITILSLSLSLSLLLSTNKNDEKIDEMGTAITQLKLMPSLPLLIFRSSKNQMQSVFWFNQRNVLGMRTMHPPHAASNPPHLGLQVFCSCSSSSWGTADLWFCLSCLIWPSETRDYTNITPVLKHAKESLKSEPQTWNPSPKPWSIKYAKGSLKSEPQTLNPKPNIKP